MSKDCVWRQVTQNCWVAILPGDVSLCVQRNRSWKANRDPKPFKIEVFGNVWAQPAPGSREGYESLAEAQLGAEQVAKKIVRGLAKWAAPATSSAPLMQRTRRAEFDALIARSSIGAAIADVKERGIEKHLESLEHEMNRPRRRKIL